ncbi:GAF domain-containing protein [Aphanothece sacrum]|uniref:Methyl-accepting chemotaxis sensory transducer with phytochrome sensor n=1 Tax=Aphanothece sacrum FPU1 TaxID=1920663 RepID=A0A401IC80_APHSA|nr:GAF domain-containing protein [Aphanothece sacrum]GBF78830.1 methyl-accepting chemotaxis sensory transducer with phytochrome sensor [Aphanothece sacrum FPU1]GBF83062.1 phytochrome-like photoreceptor protein [Aphanothece sacrum FPU3]
MKQNYEPNSLSNRLNISTNNGDNDVNGKEMSDSPITQSGYLSTVYNGWRSLGLKKQVIYVAIAGSSLPVLLIGLANSVWETTPLTLVLETGIISVAAGVTATLLMKRASKQIENALNTIKSLDKNQPDKIETSKDQLGELETRLNHLSSHWGGVSQDQNRTTQQQRLFATLAFRIREKASLEVLYKITVEEARKILETDRVVVYKFNPDWSGTMVAESVAEGFPTVLSETILDPCFEKRHAAQYQSGRIRGINDIYTEPGMTSCYINLLEKYKIRANLVVPIRGDEKLYGLLITHQCSGPKQWQKTDIDFLSQLAIEFEYHLKFIHILQEKDQETKQRQLLSSIAYRTRQNPSLETLFNTAVEGARDLLKTDRISVYQFNPDWSGTMVAESVAEGFPSILSETILDPCFEKRHAAQYQSGRIRGINDIYTEPGMTDCYINLLEKYKVRANLVVPIRGEEKIYGLLIAHQCSGPKQWQKEDIDVLSQLANELEYHVKFIHVLQEKERQTRQRQLFSTIAFRTRQTPQLNVLFNTTVEGARDIMKADRVVVYKFNPDWSGTMIAESVGSGFPSVLSETIIDPCFEKRNAAQYQEGRIRAINDIYTEPGMTDCHINLLEKYKVRANLVVPLRKNEKLYGLLIAHHCADSHHWEPWELDFLSQLATEAEYSLDYISFINQQQAGAQRAWFFGEIAFRARQSLNLQEIFQATVQGTRKILKTDRVLIYHFNADWSGTMIAESVADGFPKVLAQTIDDPCFRSQYVEAYKKGRVKAINDIYNEPGLSDCHIRTLEKYEVKANIVAPLRQNGELFGLLIAHHCSEAKFWEKTDIDFLSQVATQVEYAIDHLSFIEKIQETAGQARLFGDISFRARRSLSMQDILTSTVEGARKTLNTDRVLIYRFNADWSGTMIAESIGEGFAKVLSQTIDDPCFRGRYIDLYRNGRVRAINDIHNEPGLTDCHIRTLEQYGVKANLVAPLRKNNELFGLIIAHHCSKPRVWKKSDIDFFSELATQTEYALDHITYIEQLQQARQIAETASQEQRQQKEAIQHQLDTLLKDVNGAFKGDLTVRSTAFEGEIGRVAQFINKTLENLQRLVLQVQSASHAVTQTANHSAQDIKSLAAEAQEASAVITTALTQSQGMADSIQSVAANAQQAKLKVEQADQSVKEGDEAMNLTVESILAIQNTVEETSEKLKRLGEASQKISRVVSLIRDLASQTQVLALNASIEANELSQDGQGFAVVANEVRSLSERSTAAAEEIEEMVEEIQTETKQVITAMEAGREQVISGTELVEITRQKLTSIAQVSEQIRDLVEEIAQAATVQAETSASVSSTMQAVDTIAQKTSERSVKQAESFETLLRVAQALHKSVAQFKVR